MQVNKHFFKILLSTLAVLGSVLLAAGQPSITLEQIWKDRYFAPKTIRLGKSMANGLHYSIIEKQTDINIHEYQTGGFLHTVFSTEGLLTDPNGKALRVGSYHFSPCEKFLLVGVKQQQVYRYSYTAEYYLWDIEKKQLKPLSEGTRQTLPVFSPDGKMVAFVRQNNVFIKDLRTNSETAVTNDGLANHIINGTTDWVYEEEFGFTQGIYWSADSRRLAYYRFDESHVKEFTMMIYGSLYPDEYRFKYPKAGERNSIVTIHIYNVQTGKTLQADTGPETDQYIPRIKWTTDPSLLCIYRMNRHQNQLELLLVNATTGANRLLYHETNPYFIDVNDDLTFLEDGRHFIISSEKSGYRHLYLYNMLGHLVRPLTSGNWDVQRFAGVDHTSRLVFYTSHQESPLTNHLYSIRLDGRQKTKLTAGTGMHNPTFSRGFKYFINQYSNANTPPVFSIHKSDGTLIKVLENNSELAQKTQQYKFTNREFFNFTTSEGVLLNGWMMKPTNFDPTRKHPLIMYVYGGPDSQTVLDRWDASNGPWFQMLTQMGFVVVSVDNRGTGARGQEFRKMTYLRLGKFETIDQIEAAKYLGTLPFIDQDRIGIFGWSYGGYLSLLSLAKGAGYFKAAIAVAPVTNWRFYDTIYTERYLRTPQENPAGYDENSPINHAGKIKGKLLLVHGSADDNVHYQNTMEMATALIQANIPFELAIYPNHNHAIVGGNARLHLYDHMTRFLLNSLLAN